MEPILQLRRVWPGTLEDAPKAPALVGSPTQRMGSPGVLALAWGSHNFRFMVVCLLSLEPMGLSQSYQPEKAFHLYFGFVT